ncbi:MAG: hypothetical protein MJ180_03320 [Candidatus Gastranaerophilales bacterium]|nr:hypothetical protein [Candidatus Gastranaerophilales bacterium]
MRKATQIISSMMQKNVDVKKILHMTEYCINIINKIGKTKSMFGIKKTVPTGFIDLLSKPETRGYEYTQIYKKYFKNYSNGEFYVPKANEAYSNAITCKILIQESSVAIQTGKNNPANIETNLTLVEKAYKLLKEKKSPTKKEIVDTAATIQWLIAQETPYKRGSDSVANLFTRSLLDSYGIELSPLKAGVSCDYEAFYRDLDDYIKIYPTLFEKNLMN